MVAPRAIDLLSDAQCAQAARSVDELAPLWIKRKGQLHTLGAAAYLDAPHPFNVERSGLDVDPEHDYVARSQALNPRLADHFGWLYEVLRCALADALGEQVELAPDKALPGFHIYASDPIYERVSSHYAHVDRPYASLDWSAFADVEFDRSISYTLPIEVPSTGGGLRIWKLDLSQAQDWPRDVVERRLREAGSEVHAYEPGRMILHSGHALHRVEPWTHVEGERRLTLQGHGLRCDAAWQLYF